MIAALTGKCNGAEVLFSRSEDGKFRCAVPEEKSGTYVVELSATDQAGNTAFFASILLSYDPATLQVSFRVTGIGAGFSAREVSSVLGCASVAEEVTVHNVDGSCTVPKADVHIGMG